MSPKTTSVDQMSPASAVSFMKYYGLLIYVSSSRSCREYSSQNITITWLSSHKRCVCLQSSTNFYTKIIFLLDPRHVVPLATLSHPDSFPELSVARRESHVVQEIWDTAKQTQATSKGPVNSPFPKDFKRTHEPRLLEARRKGSRLNLSSSSKQLFLR